ncbi:MAG: family phage tail tape measure protein, partial [Comamonadaceae bacterium]
MAQFADPASKFRTELAGAGITTTNFEKALRQLAAAGPAGSKAINAVGTEAGPALRSLLNQGIGALDALKGKLDDAAGSAAKTAAVMEGNLKGAFTGLSSAWDTVKNALATPVLPVLTSGVQSLSKAFTDAVSSGIVGKFGDSIATASEGGIKWVKAFAAELDPVALGAKMQAFAADTNATFTKIGEYATNAGSIVKLSYGVMSSGANAVMMSIYGIGAAYTEAAAIVVNGALRMTEALQKIAIGSAKQKLMDDAAVLRMTLGGLTAASEAFADKSRKAFIDMADSAQTARDGWTGLATATQSAVTQSDKSATAIKELSQAELMAANEAKIAEFRTNELALSFETAGKKAQDSGDKQQAAAIATKERVAALRAEYEAAVATDNWQLAAEKMQALANAAKDAKTGTAEARKKAEEDAAAIEAAFTRAAIKTKTELTNAAKTAKDDFELIKSSGQATADGVQAAFKRYAEAAIAANVGVASEAIKSEAAMHGLQVQTDSTGKSIVKSMTEGAAAVKTVEDAYHQLGLKTPEELNKIAASNEAAWAKIKDDSHASVATLKSAFNTYAQSAIAAAGDVGSAQYQVTKATLETEAAVKGLSVTFDENGKIVVRTQAEAANAINKATSALEQQSANA